ncbi:hypothetical protein [Xanthomonas sp. XNM01]|uniref:hypothetical protein n=1 Tax=Xanthomonas sp. XNM01 TaxID=2769289 RepID=UPI0017815BDC|nr:hypothetical protein [Xanthomonas sp. XNM01]MBD9367661.1 hypothetical protein [Xanthomonas sp. XNM01]
MLKKTLKSALFLCAALCGAASAQQSQCSFCDAQLHRCLTNGVIPQERCLLNYENCRAEACTIR